MTTRTRRLRWLLPAAVAVAWLAAAGPLNILGAGLTDLQKNDQAAFLPDSAESTRVTELERRFQTEEALPAVIVWEQPDGITPDTRQAATARLAEVTRVAEAAGALAGEVSPPIPSGDGQALQAFVPLAPDTGNLGGIIQRLHQVVQVPGVAAYVTGPAGITAAFTGAFEGIDGLLLASAFGVVGLILLAVYRSPLLPLLVIATAGLALSAGTAVAYLLAREGLITVNGQSQGIAAILVVGAATDYGLLLVARYREELRRTHSKYTAMAVAWRRATGPVVASGATVILGVLCLLASDLASNRGLGPISAVNVVFAMLAALTFLPAALTVLGRAAFWPRRPVWHPHAGSEHAEHTGSWERIASLVGRRPAAVLAASTLLLLAGAAFLPGLDNDGVSQTEAIRGPSQAVTGQQVLTRHFDTAAASPAVIITPADSWRSVARAARGTDGVAQVAQVPADGTDGPVGAPTGPPGRATQPKVVDGLVQLNATLTDPADSDAAVATVRQLRDTVHAAEPDALVGGRTAADVDTRSTAARDQAVIIPLVLVTITIVLAVLLRALLAPVLLVATVVLSFAATLGTSVAVFNLLGLPEPDPTVVLIGFVFLIALGIDYNIFLMTRAREESATHGTRTGVLRALTVTGGVITSAGLVLAATFGALVVLPLLILTQVAFIVAFGVLLDTFIVRSLLVPALTHLLGDRIWWPSPLARHQERDAFRPGGGRRVVGVSTHRPR